jgi:hypothetical protein
MKLYEVPRDTRVVFEDGIELIFQGVDGMYAKCIDDQGNQYLPTAWTEVTIKATQGAEENT